MAVLIQGSSPIDFRGGTAARISASFAVVATITGSSVGCGLLGIGDHIQVIALIFTAIGLLGQKAASQAKDRRVEEQVRRNSAAWRARHCIAGEKVNYILYLRPFFSDKSARYRSESNWGVLSLAHWTGIYERTLEAGVADAFWPALPTIAIGSAGGFGSGYLETPDTAWQDEVGLVASRATIIVAVPLPGVGTLWEMDFSFGIDFCPARSS